MTEPGVVHSVVVMIFLCNTKSNVPNKFVKYSHYHAGNVYNIQLKENFL